MTGVVRGRFSCYYLFNIKPITAERVTTSWEHSVARSRVEAGFDGGSITSDAGVVLLREPEERLGILSRSGRSRARRPRQCCATG